jgi:osmotically inducible protein OsmC
MPRIERTAEAIWTGSVARGSGTIAGLSSGAFRLTYDEPTRVADPAGNTSPEELIAAAHAGCFAMSLAAELSRLRVQPERVSVQATCVMDEVEGRGHLVVESQLDVEVAAPGLDHEQLEEAMEKAHAGCPISTLIRATAHVALSARLA